ncbi:hypothetical protein BJX63DRAFT_127382 [Aspergillus granulosus]|uniref:Uncharacterized protein n=1 Tax=Aspergillus granulosus TaxID=176169 RepID=A0ABR4I4H9_9EURO
MENIRRIESYLRSRIASINAALVVFRPLFGDVIGYFLSPDVNVIGLSLLSLFSSVLLSFQRMRIQRVFECIHDSTEMFCQIAAAQRSQLPEPECKFMASLTICALSGTKLTYIRYFEAG